MKAGARALLLIGAVGTVTGTAALDLGAQSPTTLSAGCTAAGGDQAMCAATAVAGRALLGQLGLASGLGSEVPGTASNLGRRVGSKPRVAFALRAGVLRVPLPDLGDPSGLGESSFHLPIVHTSVTAGVFDGFRLMPTVGGFLSVDLLGQLAFLLLPTDEGFEGRASSLSLGARIGIFRESFTLPGVSVSVSRRFVGNVALGASGDPAQLAVDPSVTSVRATIGKDLFAVEVLGGLGWDDYSTQASYVVLDGVGGFASGSGAVDAARRVYFVGAAMSYSLVFSLSAEVGLAQGFNPVSIYSGTAFDPTASSVFGSVAFRLTI